VPTVSKNTVRVMPFRIKYALTADTIPDANQFGFGSIITLVHVKDFIRVQFNSIFSVIVNLYEFRILDTGVDPVTIDYAVDIVFAQDSPFIPLQQEVDALVELAFLEPNKATLLESLCLFQKSDLPFGFY
jgi:hypothetical protein